MTYPYIFSSPYSFIAKLYVFVLLLVNASLKTIYFLYQYTPIELIDGFYLNFKIHRLVEDVYNSYLKRGLYAVINFKKW